MKDLPDWTRQVIIRYEGGFIGLEELAARLGSIAPFDLRGNIVLMEDFESEETEWGLSESGGSSLASRSSRHKFSGDWAIKLLADDIAGAEASMTRYVAHPGDSKYALFGRVGWDYNLKQFVFGVTFDLLGDYTYAQVRYSRSDQTLAIKTGSGTWETIASSLKIESTDYIFHTLLLTFNLTTGYYDKLYLDDTEYDLASYALSSLDDLVQTYLGVSVTNYAVSTVGSTIYVDDIIIAKNVP